MSRRQILLGTTIVGAGIMLGRAMGFARDAVIASKFGIGPETDVVVALLTVPDVFLNFLALGALSAALIPEFAKAGDQLAADTFFWKVSFVTAAGAAAIAAAAGFFAPQILALLAPGIDGRHAETARDYLPICLWAVPLTALAGVSTARLQTSGAFVVPALGTLIFNSVMVAAILWGLDPSDPIRVFSWAIVIAAGIRWVSQLARLRAWRKPERVVAPSLARATWRRYGEAVWALGAITLLPVAAKAMASSYGSGELARFHFAQRLVELPMALAVGMVTVAAFPVLVAAYAEGREQKTTLAWTMVGVLIVAMPLSSSMFVFREEIAVAAFGWGDAGPATLIAISDILGVGLLAVPLQGIAVVVVTILNSRLDTSAPALINFGCLVGFLPLAWALGRVFGPMGVMAGLVVANAASVIFLVAALRRRHAVALWSVVDPFRLAASAFVSVGTVAGVERLHSGEASFGPASVGLLGLGMATVALLILTSPLRDAVPHADAHAPS